MKITRLTSSLLMLRLGVAVVMIMWTLDKFINPGHTAAVWERFYMIEGLGTTMVYLIGIAQALVVLAFTVGLLKRWSYGIVMVLHGVSTFSSYKQYLDPWDHLLFFAAWPMLAACVALYLLRKDDTLLSVDAMRKG